eukprot:5395204-Alexandrium_andersonii.AAC.1
MGLLVPELGRRPPLHVCLIANLPPGEVVSAILLCQALVERHQWLQSARVAQYSRSATHQCTWGAGEAQHSSVCVHCARCEPGVVIVFITSVLA